MWGEWWVKRNKFKHTCILSSKSHLIPLTFITLVTFNIMELKLYTQLDHVDEVVFIMPQNITMLYCTILLISLFVTLYSFETPGICCISEYSSCAITVCTSGLNGKVMYNHSKIHDVWRTTCPSSVNFDSFWCFFKYFFLSRWIQIWIRISTALTLLSVKAVESD